MTSEHKIHEPVAQLPALQEEKKLQVFMRRLKARFFLRFHMSLILTATALSGLLASKLLLLLQVSNIVIRYPLTVICSYLAFFLFVKLWLAYLTSSRTRSGQRGAGDIGSGLPDLTGGGSGPDANLPGFSGSGGGAGGGGATGALDGPATNAQVAFIPSSPAAPDTASGGGGSIGDAVSGGFDFDGDSVIFIAIAVLLAAIFGSAIYLIYIAPHILSEAAFDFLLGSSLIRGYKRMNHPDWIGSVFKDTGVPFFIVLLVSVGAALVIHAYAPEITKISDLFNRQR